MVPVTRGQLRSRSGKWTIPEMSTSHVSFRAAPSSVTKPHALASHPVRDVNPGFVQCIHLHVRRPVMGATGVCVTGAQRRVPSLCY